MVLLDAVNGMDLVFGAKDTAMLIGGIVSLATAYLTLKFSFNAHKDATQVKFETMKSEHYKDVAALKEETLNATNGRRAIKKEMMAALGEKFDVVNLRVDKTQEEIKTHKGEVQSEFKEINMNLNKILGILETQQKGK